MRLALAAAASLWLAPSAFAGDVRLNTSAGVFTASVTSWRDMPFRTVVRQQHDFSCGSAALATLLTHHYGRPTGEAEVFEAMYAAGDQERIQERGFSLLDMQRELAALGYQADGYRVPLSRLQNVGTPAIVLIETNGYRHFVVVKGIRDDQVLIGDPSAGLLIYPRAQFEAIWNGVIFVIHGTETKGAFDLETEWNAQPRTDPRLVGRSTPIEPMLRDLPPAYQITPIVRIDS
jgi:predicted double-glycine peptidase